MQKPSISAIEYLVSIVIVKQRQKVSTYNLVTWFYLILFFIIVTWIK